MKTRVLKPGIFLLPFNLFFLLLIAMPGQAEETSGGLTGVIRYQGTPLRSDSVPVTKDAEICGSSFIEKIEVNSGNKGVSNVVISLKNKAGRSIKPYPHHLTPAKISVKGCHFNPAVYAIDLRDTLRIENQDPILHVFQFSREEQSLFALPAKANGNLTKKFDREGVVQVRCVLHNFMKTSIAVVDTPFYTLSDQDGQFNLPEVAPGKYRLTIWHPLFKPLEKEIEISPGQALSFSTDLEPALK
ncbi:MAG TPA: carboxypeptidase regulatory-like domain-containing protein [Nitrospiria bacterium]|nr:carboxypeptidase regulatory-like domain-containing protein [Nitrospiria bacterium]